MNFIEQLNKLDTSFFLYLNGKHNAFFDFIMYWASNKFIWIPLYVLIIFLLVKKLKANEAVLIFLMVIMLIVSSDQLSATLLKNFFHRLRPCHNEEIKNLIHLVGDCGGQFGFVSSHAANCFALFTFLIIIFHKQIPHLKYVFFLWPVLVSYSRIYLGVHYPGDVFCGAVLGIILGYLFSKIYFYFQGKLANK